MKFESMKKQLVFVIGWWGQGAYTWALWPSQPCCSMARCFMLEAF